MLILRRASTPIYPFQIKAQGGLTSEQETVSSRRQPLKTSPFAVRSLIRRILKPHGLLIISNLDPGALNGVDRVRCLIRIIYHGITGYRLKAPRGFGKNILTEKQLCDLLIKSSFQLISTEIIKDTFRPSNIPIEYIRGCESLTADRQTVVLQTRIDRQGLVSKTVFTPRIRPSRSVR
jgi:hypothetical protein